MIFFEQGVFRAGTYLNTAMMSFCSLITKEGMLHLENRFSQFCNEIERLSDSERKDFKILTKKQILSIFLMPNYLHYLDNFQTPDEYNKPGNSSVIYEIGCATGATFDIRYLHETLYSDSELIYTTMQNYDLKDIIVRRHPGDPTQSNFLQYSTKKAYDDSHNATEFILKCKRIASTGSNVSIEAAFWGRTPYVLTSCGAYNKTLHNLKIKEEQLVDDLYLNWYAFSFLFPREFYFDYDYMTYRLSNPPEIELYNKNLDYYLKQSRIRRSLLEIEPEESVKKIRELRALTVME
ncbi:MAG: hypothetical protein LBM93_05825 [Oscillospiraceae bacterium]|jgi:hypothetical protein|nr:hypothetical protein [Oscillospiraceae bacterium]